MPGYSFTGNPVDYQPPAAPAPKAAAPPPNVGPTGFWGRISQIGIGKVNALNAYRKVAGSGPTVDSNNSPLKTAARDTAGAGKFVAKQATTGEQKFAQGIARVLPGGTNDIKAQANAVDEANKQLISAHDMFKSGKINKDQFIHLAKMAAGSSDMSDKELHQTISEMPTRGQIAAGAAATVLDMVGAGKLVDQGAKYTLEKGAQRGIIDKAASKLATRGGTAALSASDAAAHTTAGGGDNKQKALNAAIGGAIPVIGPAISGGRKLISSVTGKLINRGDAKAAQTAAQDVLTKHNLDDITKTTKAPVRDESQATAVNVNRPNAPKLLTSGEKSTVKGPGFTMNPQADPGLTKMSMRLNQINNKLDKVAQGKSFMHPDDVKALAAEKQSIYREANGAQIPKATSDRLTADIKANGGTTATVHGAEPTSGYAFAPRKDTEHVIPLDQFKSQHLQDYTAKWHDELQKPGAHLGAWVDGDKVYLDVSHVGPASAETLQKAQGAQQLAAFDLEHFKEIPLGKMDKGEYTVHDEASTIHSAHQREVSGTNNAGSTLPATEKVGQKEQLTSAAQAAKVERAPEATVSQRLSRPTTLREEVPLESTNKGRAGGVSGIQDKIAHKLRLDGSINPEQAAARAGHTDFAKALRQASSDEVMATHVGLTKGRTFNDLYDEHVAGGKHTTGKGVDFLHQVEGKNANTEAHKYFVDNFQDTGKRGVAAGVIDAARDEGYVPRMARFNDNRGAASVGGLKKTGPFAKGRVQAGEFGEGGDKYKTFGEFKTAVEGAKGQVIDNPKDIFTHGMIQRERAIAHANALDRFEHTAMNDGNPALVTFNQSKGLPIKYQQLGYDTSILPGRAVHPDAVNGIKALSSSFNDNPAMRAVSAINSKAKRLVTINGLVHAKNFELAAMRKMGVLDTAKAMLGLKARGYSEADVNRFIQHGGTLFEGSRSNLFDQATNGEGALGKALSPLGKIREGSDKFLFDNMGNNLMLHTFKHVEKAAIKAGLNPTEAAVVAARSAKDVGFISSATESSQAYREISRVAFFAGQFLKSTLKEGAKATGLSRDQTLSKGAQTFEQRQSAKALMRGFMYLFTAAQGMNMATTGHPTWQNKDSKISPVFHIDPKTGKEYHLTNFYGQIGELLHIADPKAIINKLSPGIQTGSQIVANYQQFKGQQVYDKNASGPHQWLDIFKNALSHTLTPAGINSQDIQKYTGPTGQPGKVTAAQLLGYGTSSKDQNAMERDIIQRRNNQLPANPPSGDKQVIAVKAAAKNDLRKGNTSSPNLAELKAKISAKDYKAFVKTGGDSDVQAAFDKLPTDQKFQVIEKYNPKQLSELDLTSAAKALVGSNAKSTYEALKSKGYSDQQIQDDLKKAGFDGGQLEQIKQAAKVEARQTSRQSRYGPKWVNPLLTR
jgi:hypothetical protein